MTLARSTSRGSDFELAYASPTLLRAKGADQESLHRHNSKKHRPRAFSDEAGRMGRDGRNRRSRGSSDDEGQVTPDGFSNEDLRVGGPYLCSIPADAITVPGSHPRAGLLEHKTANGKALSQRIFDILRENQIELASISSFGRSQDLNLMLRRSQFNPEPQPTVTIVTFATRRMVDDTWLKAARQIYSLLCNEHIAQVSVEIIDPQAMRPPSTSPILRRDPIFNKWDPVLGEILQEVDLTDICAIGCYRRGRSSDISENPPTVLILVDISSSKSWKSTRDLVVRILARSDLHMVAVEIMKDRICKMANLRKVEGFESDLMRGRAIVGSPIANELNDEGSGSLGGFIQLQGPTSEWFTFLLTCFHVVDPPDKKILAEDRPSELAPISILLQSYSMLTRLTAVDEWRQSGVPFSLRASKTPAERDLRDRNLTISQPSKLAASEKIASHQKTIDFYKTNPTYELGLTMSQEGILSELSEARRQVWNKISDAVNQEETTIDNIRRFVQRGADSAAPSALGFVNAASGYQRKVLHDTSGGNLTTMLDWALVRVDDKKDGDSSLHFSNRVRFL